VRQACTASYSRSVHDWQLDVHQDEVRPRVFTTSFPSGHATLSAITYLKPARTWGWPRAHRPEPNLSWRSFSNGYSRRLVHRCGTLENGKLTRRRLSRIDQMRRRRLTADDSDNSAHGSNQVWQQSGLVAIRYQKVRHQPSEKFSTVT
jgi:hypothetical protein